MTGSNILIDAHAHLNDADADAALDAASANFGRAAERLRLETPAECLLLAEPAGRDRFGRLCDETEGRWRFRPTDEPAGIRAAREGRTPIHIFAGRQITVREQLEVHALVTRERFPEGESLLATVAMVRDAGAIAVLPWGVGKWLGRRGAAVRRVLERHPDVLISDNGGRPWPWPLGGIFRDAAREGRPILAGSDPLPLGADWTRLGSYGVVCEVALDTDRPADSIRRAVRSGPEPRPFGRRRGLLRALGAQTRMQLRKQATR